MKTLELAGWKAKPYHVYVPSFGEWGYVLAGHEAMEMPVQLPTGLRFLTAATVPMLFDFPRDMQRVEAEANRLNDQVLVRYYDHEWSQVAR